MVLIPSPVSSSFLNWLSSLLWKLGTSLTYYSTDFLISALLDGTSTCLTDPFISLIAPLNMSLMVSLRFNIAFLFFGSSTLSLALRSSTKSAFLDYEWNEDPVFSLLSVFDFFGEAVPLWNGELEEIEEICCLAISITLSLFLSENSFIRSFIMFGLNAAFNWSSSFMLSRFSVYLLVFILLNLLLAVTPSLELFNFCCSSSCFLCFLTILYHSSSYNTSFSICYPCCSHTIKELINFILKRTNHK